MDDSLNNPRPVKRVLVLAGGGIRAAAFEIGVLSALERLWSDKPLCNVFDVIIGTSAGSFVGALIAQGFTAKMLAKEFLDPHSPLYLRSQDIYSVSWSALLRGLTRAGYHIFTGFAKKLVKPRQVSWLDIFYQSFQHLPAGFLRIEPLEHFLCIQFEKYGLKNDFSHLKTQLWIPVTDLDTGERFVLGSHSRSVGPGITICKAVTASSAIPYLFGPININGRWCVDGAIAGGMNLDLAVEMNPEHIVLIHAVSPMLHVGSIYCVAKEGDRVICSGMAPIVEQSNRIVQFRELDWYLKTLREGPKIHIISPSEKVSDAVYSMSYEHRKKMVEEGYQSVMRGRIEEELAGIFNGR